MLTLTEQKKQQYRAEREEAELHGLTPEELAILIETGKQWLVDFNSNTEKTIYPVIDTYSMLRYVIGQQIIASHDNADYAFRVLSGYRYEDEDKKQFNEIRYTLIEALKVDMPRIIRKQQP